jgi:HK97 family phage major capsid protein/HK97 family phage prohead protease
MTQDASAETPRGTAARVFPEKLKPMVRAVDAKSIQVRKEGDKTSITFSASSEEPIERWFGDEVLSHDDKAVRMDRLARGAAPLLFNHNWDDPIGMIDSARIEDKRLVVDAHFFDTTRAQEIRAMVDGGLRNVSIGYRLHVVEEDVDENTYTARDWEPYEISIVAVPADPSVGVGRALGDELEVRMLRAVPPVPQQPAQIAVRSVAMTDQVTAPAGASADVKVSAMQAEQGRRDAILALCKGNRIDARVESQWIMEGTPLEDIREADGKVKVKGVASQILDVIEERGKARPAVAAEIGLTRKEANQFSLFRVIRHLKDRGDTSVRQAAGFELECSAAVAKKLGRDGTSSVLIPAEVLTRPMGQEAMARAMATTPGSKGGYLVNVENMGFIDILRNRSVTRNLGARVLSGLEGNVVFPRQTGKQSVTWQAGEHVSVTAGDQALGQLSMTPKTAIAITDVSEQLLRQSSPSAEQFVMADLAAVIAIDGVDAAAINGVGGAQPLGVKSTTGITSGQSASSVTYAKLLAFPVAAGAVNAIRGNPGWVTNIAGAAILMQKQRFSSTDTPVWEGNLMDGNLVGFRAMVSEQLASGNLIFGSWDELVIGEWGVLELATDTGGTRFNTATVGIRAMWMVDTLLRYPQAFVVSTDLSA